MLEQILMNLGNYAVPAIVGAFAILLGIIKAQKMKNANIKAQLAQVLNNQQIDPINKKIEGVENEVAKDLSNLNASLNQPKS